jgi:hypothetical protein
MSAAERKAASTPEVPEIKITLDDVKHRARAVSDLAKSEGRRVARELLHEEAGRTVAAVAVGVAVLVSLAFATGAAKGARNAARKMPEFPPNWPR